MFKFFLVVHTLIAAALVGVILMQRSEGGGFAGGGSPTGLLSARGAGDFLTRTTAILAALFILLSIGLAGLATVNRAPAKLDDTLKRSTGPAVPGLPGMAPGAPAVAPSNAAPANQPAPSAIPALPGTQPELPAAASARPSGERPTTREQAPRVTEQPRSESRTQAPAPAAPVSRPERVQLPSITPAAPKADAPAQPVTEFKLPAGNPTSSEPTGPQPQQ